MFDQCLPNVCLEIWLNFNRCVPSYSSVLLLFWSGAEVNQLLRCIPAMNFMVSPINVRESGKYNEKKNKASISKTLKKCFIFKKKIREGSKNNLIGFWPHVREKKFLNAHLLSERLVVLLRLRPLSQRWISGEVFIYGAFSTHPSSSSSVSLLTVVIKCSLFWLILLQATVQVGIIEKIQKSSRCNGQTQCNHS